ncbi:MAG: hypothetical protein WCL36_11490 [bacterium]
MSLRREPRVAQEAVDVVRRGRTLAQERDEIGGRGDAAVKALDPSVEDAVDGALAPVAVQPRECAGAPA